ncbi:MAG: BREX system Lon protease-like protein BrxL [Syntrophobacteraceae bacterium]|jgi:hypothetical protein|nr:BREX system Lon protease-like protein BrxL [Syntrophobacteraceae bacterium]
MNDKFQEIFRGKVVNKAHTINTGLDELPRYVLEYLIDNYCEEETFHEDMAKVVDTKIACSSCLLFVLAVSSRRRRETPSVLRFSRTLQESSGKELKIPAMPRWMSFHARQEPLLQKISLRSFPLDVTWCNAPGCSMRSDRASVCSPVGSFPHSHDVGL